MARIKTKIRKGDTVVVVTGRERGKSGKVLSVDTINGKVLVEKLNMIKRHTKPNQKLRQGGILEREAHVRGGQIHVSSQLQYSVSFAWRVHHRRAGAVQRIE